MSSDTRVTVLMLARLHGIRAEAGMPATVEVDVPPDGRTAADLALDLGLPLDAVEGLFHNHIKAGLDSVIRPGDRVAFVPYGTPASHPAFFGPFGEARP